MTDWSRSINPVCVNRERYLDEIVPYCLENDKWRKLTWSDVHSMPIRKLSGGPYLFKTVNGSYLCGNDDVWGKLGGKPQARLIDFFKALFGPCLKAGREWETILASSFRGELSVLWSHEIFGGEFVNEVERTAECSSPTQTSIPF